MSDGMRKYLEWLASVGPETRSIAKFILDEGRYWPTSQQTFAGRRMTQKECFRNASKMAFWDRSLTYVEGYALSIIPIHHAWVVDRDGFVIDPTWRSVDLDRAYFGVAFSTTYLAGSQILNGTHCLLDPYYSRNTIVPLLDGQADWKPTPMETNE